MVRTAVPLDLSPREREVLLALTEHRSNAEIAQRFVLSVRTVESHVASLLRKTGAANRRELADLGAALTSGPLPDPGRARPPEPPSSFIGRAAEQAALAETLRTDRLVTALGPGGVGKTRLALAVAHDDLGFPDGAVYVDLVPVADPARVASAVAAAAGVGAQQAASPEEALEAWLHGRRVLLVVDNCEHLLDGVAPLLERLLATSEGLTVLATSRTRLLVPYERVVPIPGLSVDAASGTGDAVELFRRRAEAQGAVLPASDDRRIAAICLRLDGMALAIELAAARVPSIGLDGLELGLAGALDLLAGGSRSDERHRSLRATLEWSVSLLEPGDRDVLARCSVFAGAFRVDAAAFLLGTPVPATQAALARLADSSLLDARNGRYRMLETVRQHGVERLAADGLLDDVRSRHLDWCLTAAVDAPFDDVAPELRAAVVWAAGRAEARDRAFSLADRLAAMAFLAGAPAEAQTWFEEAAGLAPDAAAAVSALRDAAGAAEARNVGLDALRLHRAAAALAESDGDRDTGARELARAAILVPRGPGLMAEAVPISRGLADLQRARELASGDPLTDAHIRASAAMFEDGPRAAPAAREAVEAAARLHDGLLENVALDALTSALLVDGDIRGALGAASRRLELLSAVPLTARTGLEFADAFSMTAECAMAAGDLRLATECADGVRRLPAYAREPHLATSRAMTIAFLVGDWRRVTELAPTFLDGWIRAGRPRAGNLQIGSQAASAAFAMRGDEEASARWRGLIDTIASPSVPLSEFLNIRYAYTLVAVHQEDWGEAERLLEWHPDRARLWHQVMWRPWYAALWAEAAVLMAQPDAAARIAVARRHAEANEVAQALVDRAAILLAGSGDLSVITGRLQGAGARYQAARTRVLAGGEEAERGRAALAELGTAPLP